jgi:phosphoribosylformylglycinamidine synthase
MEPSEIKVCILRIEGTNCEQEMYESFERLGARPEMVHLNQLLGRQMDKGHARDLFDYHCLMIPGGFSAGDYVRAGAIWAARMKSALGDELVDFVKSGRLVGGICNGFQVLVELGLLPAFGRTMTEVPQAVLNTNDSARFECRPTLLKHVNKGKCAFTRMLPKNRIIIAPSAHAEGKFMFPPEKEKKLLKKLKDKDQIVFRYVDDKGHIGDYPWNPNGALFNIAGICNPKGNVFGMMPHPERVFHKNTHPDWTRDKGKKDDGDGRIVFESAVDYLCDKF